MIGVEQLLEESTVLPEKVDLYKESLEKMNGVIFIIDYNAIGISWAGEHFEEITGYKYEEVGNLGINGLKSLFHPDDFHIYSEGYNYFMNPETKDKSHTAVYRIKHKQGHYIWSYFCSFVISRNPDETPHKAGGIMINLEKIMIPSFFEKQISERKAEKNDKLIETLSKREKEILAYISKGLSAAQIAEKFGLSKRTIETHKRNMQKKLGVSNSAALISFAISIGI
jgi:PAS domain S-box-containing protein